MYTTKPLFSGDEESEPEIDKSADHTYSDVEAETKGAKEDTAKGKSKSKSKSAAHK